MSSLIEKIVEACWERVGKRHFPNSLLHSTTLLVEAGSLDMRLTLMCSCALSLNSLRYPCQGPTTARVNITYLIWN